MTPAPIAPIAAEVKFTLVALAAAAIFGAGWLVEGWRMEREFADLKRHYAEQAATAADQNTIELAQANDRADRLQVRLAAEEDARQTILEEKNNALRRLTAGRPCLSEPVVRVLNGGGAAIQPRLVSQAAGEPVSADAAFASDTDVSLWIAGAQRAYDTCRGRIQAIADFYDKGELRVTDVIERGQEREAEIRADALAERTRAAEAAAAQPSAEICVECDEPISALRREKVPGVQTCVECQERLEWLQKRGLRK